MFWIGGFDHQRHQSKTLGPGYSDNKSWRNMGVEGVDGMHHLQCNRNYCIMDSIG